MAIGSNEYYAGDDSAQLRQRKLRDINAVTLSNATQWANPMTCPVDPEMVGTILTIQGNPTIDSFSLGLPTTSFVHRDYRCDFQRRQWNLDRSLVLQFRLLAYLGLLAQDLWASF